MKILFTLEHTIATDILNILRRLPFQPHFLTDFEAQLNSMVSAPSEAPEKVAPVASSKAESK
jgi:hypothetical protein